MSRVWGPCSDPVAAPAPGGDARSIAVVAAVVVAAGRLACVHACLLGGLAGLAASPAAAQEFAADLVTTAAGGAARPSGKLEVSNGRVRLESAGARDGYLLVLPGAPAAWLVRPAARVAIAAGQWSALALFVAVDADDPCRAWQAMAEAQGPAPAAGERQWRCERSGDTASGQAAAPIAYRATSPRGRRYDIVIDPLLRFPVRIAGDDGTVTALANIAAAPQPEALFAVPADYRTLTLQGLIERMKQADVFGASSPPP